MKGVSRSFQVLAAVLAVALWLSPVTRAAMPASSPPQPGPDLPAAWWAEIQAAIEQAEYEISWQEQTYLPDLPAAYQAPNRAENLRTYFAPAGPILIPRAWPDGVVAPPWRWDLRLEGWGREGATQAAPPAALEVGGNRIEYRRGVLLEWYANDAEGLALGFRLAAPPQGERRAPLRLALAWEGGLSASGGGPEVAFAAAGKEVLRLGDLSARDAAGRTLEARWIAGANELVCQVDDAAATYPIDVEARIRGLPEIADWYLTSGTPNTDFGYAVATAGDVNGDGWSDILVGAPGYDHGQTDEGGAFLYAGHPLRPAYTPLWSKEGDKDGARFGHAVASAGDVNGDGRADILVGAPDYNHPEGNEGGAWVYHGTSTGAHSAPDFFAQSDQADARLGISVGTAGDVDGDGFADIIVGSDGYDSPESGEGAAWVWHGSLDGVNGGANGLLSNADWNAEGDEAGAQLGIAVGTAGDVNGDGYADVIIGAYNYGVGDAGATMAWYGGPNGVYNRVPGTPANAEWMVTGPAGNAHLGRSVSTAGDVNGDGYADVLVGAPHYTNGQTEEGVAFLHLGSATGLDEDWHNYQEGNSAGAWFGQSVACAGDVNGDGYADVVVGAPLYSNGQDEEGAAFLWYGSDSGIGADPDWEGEGGGAAVWYGNSVATAGDVNGDGYSDLIVGAYGENSRGGSAILYFGGPDMPAQTANWSKRSNLQHSAFGFSVASAGDVNADGYADIIAGSPLWDAGQTDEGAAWIYQGSQDGPVGAPYWYKQGDQAQAQFGYAVGTAGDVNGDGYSDVIVGAPFYERSSGPENEGGAWVYHGSASGVDTTPGWHKEGNQAGGQFGYAVGTAGDVNGDGDGDVIVGAPFMEYGQSDEGVAWLYLGAAGGLNSVPATHLEGNDADGQLGAAVGTAGDVNGDGYSDVIVGAPLWDDDVINEGRAWVYYGSASGLRTTGFWHAESNLFNAQLGYAVGTAGDVNGDGYSDVIVGAPYWGDGGLTSEGRVWVFHGSADGLNPTHTWYKESGQSSAYYGYDVGTAGDVNGDGYADVLIGAPSMTGDGGQSSEGLVRLYLGSSGGLESSYAWTAEGNQASSWFGISVSTAGDVNGDGYADLVIGAKEYTDLVSHEGKVFVYYGNGRNGKSLRLRTIDGAGYPIAHLGQTDGSTFRLSTIEWNPFGRGEMLSEVEVKPLGVRFNGRDTFAPNGQWFNPILNTGTTLLAGHYPLGTPYHWRLRILYNPATTPWMPASRWVTVPWNGWNEQDLRTPGMWVALPVVLRDH